MAISWPISPTTSNVATMKITYEIEFDLPDDFPVKTLSSLMGFVKAAIRDRLPVGKNLRIRARQMLPGGVEINNGDKTLC